MELPLYFNHEKTFEESFVNFSSQYLKLLEDNKIDDATIKVVKKLTESIREIVVMYLNGKVISSYNSFKKAVKPITNVLSKKTIQKGSFYRMRSEGGITATKEFYHIPYHKVYLSKNERFSIDGYPCLYLGYSKRVCEMEISNGSLAKFVLKEPLNNILDLTLGQGDGNKDISEINLIKVYPLIASCYIVPFYCTIQEKECRPKNTFFREEYIIPQLLTLYLKEEKIADGIIYYSIKDPSLDPQGKGEKDYRNLVLFTNRGNKSDEIYDNILMEKFDITICKDYYPNDLTFR